MAAQGFGPVLAALSVLKSSIRGPQKAEAHDFLNNFQKSKEAWGSTHAILNSTDAQDDVKMFAATTLKGKIVYDLDQLPREQVTALRDSLLGLCAKYGAGPKPVRTQLCVGLAHLAIQMTEWKDVLPLVGSTLGEAAGDCVLEFLQVLPEEISEGRKINLSEEDLHMRAKELLEDNAANVLQLLINYSSSSAQAAVNPHLISCLTSWLREIPTASIAKSSLLDVVVNATSNDKSFDAAVECFSTIFTDTREVRESLEVIQLVYPRVLAFQPKIKEAADAEDSETFKGLTRIFAEAGENWAVLIAEMPNEFRGLVEAILECCARDVERDALSVTFNFWYELKQYLVLPNYASALQEYSGIYSRLVDIMVKHLQFPSPDGADDKDLFEGDRELEENFREFRHRMGDVLKDCCEVITVTTCLQKAFNIIKHWIATYASQATTIQVPHWQELEAPLFAMRAMGRMVSPEESEVLHQVIPLMVQIPDHEKLRFQAIMAIARYTEWTAQHPEFLQRQLEFIVNAFNHSSTEVVRAAALAFRFFGTDCRHLLEGEVVNLQGFYNGVLDKLPTQSQEEVTQGAAAVVSAQPLNNIYASLKLYCDPIMERIKARAVKAQSGTEKDEMELADTIGLLSIFIDTVQPYYDPNAENEAVKYCQEAMAILSTVADNFTSTPVLEALCRCWRYMVLSYRTAAIPLLPDLAKQLSTGFERTHKGSFLWATDSILREFAEGAEFVDAATSDAIYQFFEQQAYAFLQVMNDVPPQELPDVIEDFFHLLIDALIYYHTRLIPGGLCPQILNAATATLILEQHLPILSILHFLRDFLSYGTESPNSSSLAGEAPANNTPLTPAQIQDSVKTTISSQGEEITRRVLTGMMFTFPDECLQDASGVVLGLFQLMPQQTAVWIKNTIDLLPPGSIKAGEGERLMSAVAEKVQSGELRKIRSMLQDFTQSYRRRNVAPRDGLGTLEARRFKFTG